MAKRTRKQIESETEADDPNAWTSTGQTLKPPSRRSRSRSKQPNDNKTEQNSKPVSAPSTTTTDAQPPPMSAARPLALLICSIGNPGATYANTFHSAGHTVLNRLADHLGHTNFRKDRSLGNGLVSRNPYDDDNSSAAWTLWQSTAYMNESGKGVRAAWNAWSRGFAEGEARLVVVHDELEKPMGAVSVKTAPGLSAKGHNGLKSLMGVMGQVPFVRIGVGIGRPESRASGDVADYVLRKMTAVERGKVEGGLEEVVRRLEVLARG